MSFWAPNRRLPRRSSRDLSLAHPQTFPEPCGLEQDAVEWIASGWAERLGRRGGGRALRDLLEDLGGLVRPDAFCPLLLVAERVDCFRVVSTRYHEMALALAHLVLHLPVREPAPGETPERPGVLAVPRVMPAVISVPRQDGTAGAWLERRRTARAEAEWFADALQMPEARVRRAWAIHDGQIGAAAQALEVGSTRLARRLVALGLASATGRDAAE